MTAMEELRAKLDRRGVEHYDTQDYTRWGGDASGWYPFSASEAGQGLHLHIHAISPDEALALTLGVETCRPMSEREFTDLPLIEDRWVCSECGYPLTDSVFVAVTCGFCPHCGRRVVE